MSMPASEVPSLAHMAARFDTPDSLPPDMTPSIAIIAHYSPVEVDTARQDFLNDYRYGRSRLPESIIQEDGDSTSHAQPGDDWGVLCHDWQETDSERQARLATVQEELDQTWEALRDATHAGRTELAAETTERINDLMATRNAIENEDPVLPQEVANVHQTAAEKLFADIEAYSQENSRRYLAPLADRLQEDIIQLSRPRRIRMGIIGALVGAAGALGAVHLATADSPPSPPAVGMGLEQQVGHGEESSDLTLLAADAMIALSGALLVGLGGLGLGDAMRERLAHNEAKKLWRTVAGENPRREAETDPSD